MIIIDKIRFFLWRILGIDYSHILKVIDYVYLKEDAHSTIGHKSYSNNALVFRWSDAPISIGKYCSIGDNVRFIVDQGRHLTNAVSSYPFLKNNNGNKSGITIGNDVWIGQNCILMPGITIGDGATIGAGSVVTKDVPPYCVMGGSPAKIISHKCSEEEAKMMQEIAWWNRTEKDIEHLHSDFQLTIPEFIKKHHK
ncbi:MAG: CatB-related O-acetyltransferase [Bacteroidales bacterium]|nr:CatB-related O-acetyltransferase [Bacteroidales bacterium]